jgi:hypothetical protein
MGNTQTFMPICQATFNRVRYSIFNTEDDTYYCFCWYDLDSKQKGQTTFVWRHETDHLKFKLSSEGIQICLQDQDEIIHSFIFCLFDSKSGTAGPIFIQ